MDKDILGKLADVMKRMDNSQLRLLGAFGEGLIAAREIMESMSA